MSLKVRSKFKWGFTVLHGPDTPFKIEPLDWVNYDSIHIQDSSLASSIHLQHATPRIWCANCSRDCMAPLFSHPLRHHVYWRRCLAVSGVWCYPPLPDQFVLERSYEWGYPAGPNATRDFASVMTTWRGSSHDNQYVSYRWAMMGFIRLLCLVCECILQIGRRKKKIQ